MIGGQNESAVSLAHAREMLDRGQRAGQETGDGPDDT